MTTKTIWLGIAFVLSGCSLALGLERPAAEPKTLSDVVAERAFPEYATWWPMGAEFLSFMSEAIVSEWSALPGNDGSLDDVNAFVSEYLTTVYARETRPDLVEDFVHERFSNPPQSGEFDALSYAFFRSAYELMVRRIDLHDGLHDGDLETERRLLTKRVGEKFFGRLHDHLGLTLPPALEGESSFQTLKTAIRDVEEFLLDQGYYRDHVAFRFEVATEHQGRRIDQSESAFLETLEEGVAHALFEMGYPVILPSAVYLFHSLGEAQHHSSRTMESLFARVGMSARETHDFDPIGYPSDMVVELWEIRKEP